MKTTQDIVDSIENRLRELNQEIETLTAARSALDRDEARASAAAVAAPVAPAAPAAPAPVSRRRRVRRRSRTAASAEVVPAGRLETLLSENGGLTTTVLAERTSGSRDQVLTLLRELEAAGRVRRTGQRRSTRWHAVTDEDRIRVRAAELAARSKRKA
jgi:DNA-binding IclR family transcriptional regulator